MYNLNQGSRGASLQSLRSMALESDTSGVLLRLCPQANPFTSEPEL